MGKRRFHLLLIFYSQYLWREWGMNAQYKLQLVSCLGWMGSVLLVKSINQCWDLSVANKSSMSQQHLQNELVCLVVFIILDTTPKKFEGTKAKLSSKKLERLKQQLLLSVWKMDWSWVSLYMMTLWKCFNDDSSEVVSSKFSPGTFWAFFLGPASRSYKKSQKAN